MNILIPMAGAGSRFVQAGYENPKPLIDVNGKPMIQTVVENLNIDGNFIFLIRTEHLEQHKTLTSTLNEITGGCTIIEVESLTEGAACTALLAKEYINNDDGLLIANADQHIIYEDDFESYINPNIDGLIWSFVSNNPHHSFAKEEDGRVVEVAEKKVISNLATCGIYWYNKGSDFVRCAERMISRNIRTNGEFYIAPVYNEMILEGKNIQTYPVKKMWPMGTPEELNLFLEQRVLT